MKPELRVISLLENGQPVVLITVIDKQGSGPRAPGAKIVIVADGNFWGTIGGGQVENRALVFAHEFFGEDVQAALLNFQLKPGHEGENIDMLCGGRVSLLVEKFLPGDESLALFKQFVKSAQDKDWVIDLNPVAAEKRVVRYLVTKGDVLLPQLAPLRECLVTSENRGSRQSRLIEVEGEGGWFIDTSSHSGHLLLIGGGHVALEVARLAQAADFAVTVCDNRPEFASRERFPAVEDVVVAPEFANIFDRVPVGYDSYIVILTHSHSYDEAALDQALRTDAGYVGMIGSLRKRGAIYANLKQAGVSEQQLQSVHCPIGLPIGAESPFEIALSIVAELVAERAKKLRG